MAKKPKSDKAALAAAVLYIYNLNESNRCKQCPLDVCMANIADVASAEVCLRQLTDFFRGTFKDPQW